VEFAEDLIREAKQQSRFVEKCSTFFDVTDVNKALAQACAVCSPILPRNQSVGWVNECNRDITPSDAGRSLLDPQMKRPSSIGQKATFAR
jgi:hypothetical protein